MKCAEENLFVHSAQMICDIRLIFSVFLVCLVVGWLDGCAINRSERDSVARQLEIISRTFLGPVLSTFCLYLGMFTIKWIWYEGSRFKNRKSLQ